MKAADMIAALLILSAALPGLADMFSGITQLLAKCESAMEEPEGEVP